MGRWARPRYEQALFEKTVKLYDKVIGDVFGKAGEDMDLRLTTFIQKLDPESKEVQACFATLVQQVLWDKSDVRDGPRVVVDPVAEPDAYPPGPRPRRLTRSPYPTIRATDDAIAGWNSLLDTAEHGPMNPALDPLSVLPWSSAPPSRAHSPSARRRASPPPPSDPRLRVRMRPRVNAEGPARHPNPPAGQSSWELVDFYSAAAGEVDEADRAGSPQSPSRAWLDEYTATAPAPRTIVPLRSRPRTTLATMRTRPIRRDSQSAAERLAAAIEAPPPLRQVRPREDDPLMTQAEQRAAQRRRMVERRASEEDNGDSPWVPYGDRDPFPQIQPPSLRRSDSSWENAAGRDFIRDAMGRVVTDHPPRRRRDREAVEADAADLERDTRRDGLVFEPLSPALPSSAISAASGTEGRFGPSYHLPGRDEGYMEIQPYLDTLVNEAATIGTSRNFGLGMRNVSIEGLMGVDGEGGEDLIYPSARAREHGADPSLVDTPPAFMPMRVEPGDDESFTTQ